MTLGELKRDLRKHNIRVVGSLTTTPLDENMQPLEVKRCVTIFAGDEPIVFPFKPKGKTHTLVTKTLSDNEPVHSEKIKALKRALIPDWDEE